MRFARTSFALVIALNVALASAQSEQRFVILPQSEAQPFVGSGVFGLSVKVTGTWPLAQSDVNGPEAKLPKISHFPKSDHVWQTIDQPEKYFRQYLGLLAGKRRLILLSAYWGTDDNERAPDYWRDHLFHINQVGSCCWLAVYDVSAKRFVILEENTSFE